jgi:hypothetical protein
MFNFHDPVERGVFASKSAKKRQSWATDKKISFRKMRTHRQFLLTIVASASTIAQKSERKAGKPPKRFFPKTALPVTTGRASPAADKLCKELTHGKVLWQLRFTNT